MGEKIVRHQELDVYKAASEAAMDIFVASKKFPTEETYSLTDQVPDSCSPSHFLIFSPSFYCTSGTSIIGAGFLNSSAGLFAKTFAPPARKSSAASRSIGLENKNP